MQNEERRLSGYDFVYAITQDKHIYFFQTVNGVLYEALFKPSGYIFPAVSSSIQENVFEFSIGVAEKPEGDLPPPDNLIPDTIASIFRHFFKNQKRVAVYICDTADDRASARARKFNHWYEWYRGNDFSKVDLQMGSDETGQRYFTSIILHIDNPDFVIIIDAFRNLVRQHTK